MANFGVNGVASLSARQGRRKCECHVKAFMGFWFDLAAVPRTCGLFFFMTSPLLTDPHLCPSLPRLTFLFPPCCTDTPVSPRRIRLHPRPLLSVQLRRHLAPSRPRARFHLIPSCFLCQRVLGISKSSFLSICLCMYPSVLRRFPSNLCFSPERGILILITLSPLSSSRGPSLHNLSLTHPLTA